MASDVQIISTLLECKKYKDDIISSIMEILSNHDYETEFNDNKTEIRVETDDIENTFNDVNNIINDELVSVPSNVKQILLDTYKTKNGVYIRLKFK